MIKNVIFLICLFAISLCEEDYYIPMEKKSKYGDDVCRYQDKDGHYHVKPCEKGKYCVSYSSVWSYSELEICQDIPQIKILSDLNENKCSTTLECERGLTCEGSTCRKCTTSGRFDYGEYPTYGCDLDTNKGSGFCESNTYDSNNVLISQKVGPTEKYKTCGKLTISEYQGTNGAGAYYIKLNEYDYLGTVQDGEYVDKMELCESGFALYFYYGGKFDNPISSAASAASLTNDMYLRCVTPLGINKKNTGSTCSINYKIGDGEPMNYNIEQLQNPHPTEYNEMNELCDKPYIKLMSEKYREYSKSITEEERKTCGDLEGNDKYTCENNGLIKTWFAYQHPEIYLHYNGREKLEKVFDYLIQKDYPSYSFSRFLSIRLLSILFLILI